MGVSSDPASVLVIIVLGAIAWMVGFNIFKFIAHQRRVVDCTRYLFLRISLSATDE